MDPEKPRKTQKPKNPKTQVLPTLIARHINQQSASPVD